LALTVAPARRLERFRASRVDLARALERDRTDYRPMCT